ncbi:MAG: 2-C-methyl-D-erythritol 2,4-cyclodiphosphate synthase [candidate division WOR-3 bacterium]
MVSAVIVAGGKGRRIGFKKQFYKIGNKPLILFSIEVFKSLKVEDIVLVVPSEDVEGWRGLGVKVVEGGNERMHSVYNGVLISSGDYVLIHDGARANISPEVVKRVIETQGDCVIPVIKPPDSVIYNGDYINRDLVYLVQTPQKVKRNLFLKAYEMAKGIYPDEGSLMSGVLGIRPVFVEGDRWNFKITYPEDLKVLERLKMEKRIFFGYDIHRLEMGRPLYLGGVKISEDFGAVGHSDGDVIIHAVVDALLSGLGYGDIGTVFPDNDPKWEGVRSEVFARKAMELLEERGVSIKFLDITVILSKPKLAPYRDKIVNSLKTLFNTENISLKAKSGNTFFDNAVQCYALVEILLPV